jgi:hypothetical protein
MMAAKNINLVISIISGLMKNEKFASVAKNEPLLAFLNMRGGGIEELIQQNFVNNYMFTINIFPTLFSNISFDGTKIDDNMPTDDFDKIIYKIADLVKYYSLALDVLEKMPDQYLLATLNLEYIRDNVPEKYDSLRDKLNDIKKNITKLFYFCIYYLSIIGNQGNDANKIDGVRSKFRTYGINFPDDKLTYYKNEGDKNSSKVAEERRKFIEEFYKKQEEEQKANITRTGKIPIFSKTDMQKPPAQDLFSEIKKNKYITEYTNITTDGPTLLDTYIKILNRLNITKVHVEVDNNTSKIKQNIGAIMEKITGNYLVSIGNIIAGCSPDNKTVAVNLEYYITGTDELYQFDKKIVSDKIIFSPELILLHYHNGTKIINTYNINGVKYIPNGYIIYSVNNYQEYTPKNNIVTDKEILIFLHRMKGKKGDFEEKQKKLFHLNK